MLKSMVVALMQHHAVKSIEEYKEYTRNVRDSIFRIKNIDVLHFRGSGECG